MHRTALASLSIVFRYMEGINGRRKRYLGAHRSEYPVTKCKSEHNQHKLLVADNHTNSN
jgi:hypothetical protein